jgi:hypothetical protein
LILMPFKPRYFTYFSMAFFHYYLSVLCIVGIGINNYYSINKKTYQLIPLLSAFFWLHAELFFRIMVMQLIFSLALLN